MEGEGHRISVSVRNPYLRVQSVRMTGTMEQARTNDQQRITINPYIRPSVNSPKDNNPLSTMPQSQWRKSSVLQCKQKASLFRGPRTYTQSNKTGPAGYAK